MRLSKTHSTNSSLASSELNQAPRMATQSSRNTYSHPGLHAISPPRASRLLVLISNKSPKPEHKASLSKSTYLCSVSQAGISHQAKKKLENSSLSRALDTGVGPQDPASIAETSLGPRHIYLFTTLMYSDKLIC